jgi:hypothetical protein
MTTLTFLGQSAVLLEAYCKHVVIEQFWAPDTKPQS